MYQAIGSRQMRIERRPLEMHTVDIFRLHVRRLNNEFETGGKKSCGPGIAGSIFPDRREQISNAFVRAPWPPVRHRAKHRL